MGHGSVCGEQGGTGPEPLLANGSSSSVVKGASQSKGQMWSLLLGVRQNVSDRHLEESVGKNRSCVLTGPQRSFGPALWIERNTLEAQEEA